MEYIRFLDHTKSTDEQLSHDQITDLNLHYGSFVGEVIREDSKSVTVALMQWETNSDITHQFIFVIIKDNILERWTVNEPAIAGRTVV